MATLAELITARNPRYLWTLCEQVGGKYPRVGFGSALARLEPVSLDEDESVTSSGPVCANVTPCEGVRFVVPGGE